MSAMTTTLHPASRDRHYLITGGAGFIGSHLVAEILQRGDRVTVIDNFDDFYDPAIKRLNLAGVMGHPKFRLIEKDIRNLPDIVEPSSGSVDTIIHLAAAAGVRPSIEDPIRYASVNVEGTIRVLEFARLKAIRSVVFASSSSVYGDSSVAPFVESESASRPLSPYAATKRAGELLCYSAHHLFGLSVVCLRLFTVFGPRQRPDLAIHKFVDLISRGEPIDVYGDGSTRRDYTYVSDTVTGILAAAAHVQSTSTYEVINIGGGNPTSLQELITEIERATGCTAIIRRQSTVPGDMRETFAATKKAREILGFEASVALAEGLDRFVAWCRKSRQSTAVARAADSQGLA